MAFNYDNYLRTSKMPTLWCWGCGDGVILKSVIRAIDAMGWNMDDVCVVSGATMAFNNSLMLLSNAVSADATSSLIPSDTIFRHDPVVAFA